MKLNTSTPETTEQPRDAVGEVLEDIHDRVMYLVEGTLKGGLKLSADATRLVGLTTGGFWGMYHKLIKSFQEGESFTNGKR